MRRDAADTWRLDTGQPLQVLRGCRDIDLCGSAFTGSLPINRPGFPPKGVREISVVYIDLVTGSEFFATRIL